MIQKGKHSVLGINVHAVDYEGALATIIEAAEKKHPCAVSALAVHGVMTGALDPIHAGRLNGLDLVVPDGQPVRWALNWLHGVNLPGRVYGPQLTLLALEACAKKNLPVYFYGSTPEVLARLLLNLKAKFPALLIAGSEPSKFRRLQPQERNEVCQRILQSGARMVVVGLGCPRQEVWAYEYRNFLPMPILAVGAAFDFHAGTLRQAPKFMQDRGLEWLYRFWQEPRRLWHRYLVLNSIFVFYFFLQATGWRGFSPRAPQGNEPLESFG